MENYLTLIISLVFIFIAIRNEKQALLIIIFTLSFLIPFQNSYFPMGLPGVLVIILSLLKLKNRVKKKTYNNFSIKFTKSYYIYYLLFIGVFMGLFNTAIGLEFPDAAKSSYSTQIYNFSTYLITILCFINLLMNYGLDFKFQDKMIKVFCLSILIHFLVYILFHNTPGGAFLFHSMASDEEITNANEIRYMSLIGDYELTIDYVFTTICFCLILFNRDNKRRYIIILIISIFIGIITGTRSFLVISAFYLISILFTNIKKYKYAIAILFLIVPIILSTKILSNLTEKYTVFSRFNETIEQLNNNEKVDKITNRDFSKATSDLISNTNILGNGSFNLYKFNGNEMVSHNLFLAIYAKFGLPGLIIILGLLFYNIKLLIWIIKKTSSSSIKKEAILYLIVLLGLIMQELKISALRNISVLLIYTFFLYNIYCLYRRNKIINKWKLLQ